MMRNTDNTESQTGGNVKTFRELRFVILICMITVSCSSPTSNNSVRSAGDVETANAVDPPTSTAASTPSSDSPVTFSLATPTDAYKTAYALREKNDVNGLKRVMSKYVLEFFELMA